MTTGRVHVNWIRLCFVHTDDCNVIMFNATIWFDGSSLMIGYMIIVSSQKHDNNIYFLCRDSPFFNDQKCQGVSLSINLRGVIK